MEVFGSEKGPSLFVKYLKIKADEEDLLRVVVFILFYYLFNEVFINAFIFCFAVFFSLDGGNRKRPLINWTDVMIKFFLIFLLSSARSVTVPLHFKAHTKTHTLYLRMKCHSMSATPLSCIACVV